MGPRSLLPWVWLLASATVGRGAELRAETVAAWDAYVQLTESRIDNELEGKDGFLLLDSLPPLERGRCEARIGGGGICVLERETLSEESKTIDVPGGMIHHWYASILVPGAGLDEVLSWVQSYDGREEYYREVVDSRLLSRRGDTFHIFLRLEREKGPVTVHYNTEHEVTYRVHGETRASSRSVATRIRELDHAGEENEIEKDPGGDRGYLWRLNSYWRFEERGGGTVVECESLSLSRSIPAGAKWFVNAFINSVPRESLESTLLPVRENLSKRIGAESKR